MKAVVSAAIAVWLLGLACTVGFWCLVIYALYLVVKHFS